MADYPNRSDLRGAPQANFTGQTYGVAAQQQASQQAVPTGPPPTDTPGLVLSGPVPGAAAFNRPTERPGEPITAGADFGPGMSPIEAGIQPRVVEFDDTVMMLRQLYNAYPNPGLAKFLAKYADRMS